jgi:uncharacterized protein
MAHPLMPKATAVWLIENTALSFEQVADFCNMHTLEVQAIADGEVAVGIVGMDPIANGQLTREEIARVEKDPKARLKIASQDLPLPKTKSKGPRYTPVSKRQERPDAVLWLLKQYPELTDAQICRLVGTTKATINAVRDRSPWKTASIKPHDPVDLGMCSLEELHAAVTRARRARARAESRARRAQQRAEAATQAATAADNAAAAAPPEAAHEDHQDGGQDGGGESQPATEPPHTPGSDQAS